MIKLSEKVQTKTGIVVLTIIAIGLIVAITSVLSNTSSANRIDINQTGGNSSADAHIPGESKEASKVEAHPIVIDQQTIGQKDAPQETVQTPEPEQTEAPVKSIQEGQPQVETKPTQPPKPEPQGKITDKAVMPTYKEEDVKPQQNQPKMGDRNDKGEVYVEGFGWIKDEGGGGKGTTVGKPGDQLTGNKVGTMD